MTNPLAAFGHLLEVQHKVWGPWIYNMALLNLVLWDWFEGIIWPGDAACIQNHSERTLTSKFGNMALR